MTNKEAKDFLTHYICCCEYGTSPTDCDNPECEFRMAIRTLCGEEKPPITQGHWRSVGFEKGYAFCICPKCGKTIRLVRDNKNEFCCIADIREKAIACLYCGARMEADNDT